MDAKKEARHFVRDRCNFNKKKRIKYITIGLVISVLTGFLLYNIAFAGGTNYHHTGAAKINVAGSEMQLRFEYAGGKDELKTDGEYRSLFKDKSRSVYVWADQYSSGDLQVGIEKDGGGHITKKDRIICKTSLDDDNAYSIVTFNISYIQPAHKYINRYQADDKSWRASGNVDNQSGGRFIIFSNGIANTNSGHAASNHWVTLTVQINLSNTGMLTEAGDGKFHWATKHVSFGQNTYNFTYKTNGGTITNLNESKNIGGNAVYTRACGGGIGRVPTVTKNGYYLEGWYYDDGRKLNSSNPNITLCQGDQWVTAKWVAYKHNVTYDLQGGKYDDDKRTELNGCKIIPNGVYHMKSGCGTNMYMHVAQLDDERHSGPATVIYSGAGYIQTEWIFERYEHTQYYYIISNRNGLALGLKSDPSHNQTNVDLELWSQEEGVADYLWYLKDEGNGNVSVYNKSTGQCLDVKSAGTTNGTWVQQYNANHSYAQWWKLESVSQKDYPDRKQFGDHNLVINSVEPVYTNHTFIGWNTSRDGTGKFYYPGDTYSAINTGTNVTLYAVWQIDDYIITYDSNGGTGTMAAQSAKGETAVKLTKNVFQRAGYLFTGWATDRYAMKPSYLDEAQYPNMEPEVTLYAQWQKTGTGFIQRPFLDDKMFYKAISILGQNGTTYDREKIDSSMAHIDIADNPGYFSLKK